MINGPTGIWEAEELLRGLYHLFNTHTDTGGHCYGPILWIWKVRLGRESNLSKNAETVGEEGPDLGGLLCTVVSYILRGNFPSELGDSCSCT